MITYYVEAEQSCPECHGTGVITHPVWRDYWAEHPSGLLTPEDDERWFSARGFWEIPPEEVECGACDGVGVLRERVTLAAALAALGVTK